MPRINITSNWPGRPGWLPTQTPHRSGRVEQETHLVTPPRPTSQVPIIGFSALLQLVEWYQVRLRRNQQGGSSCVDPQPPLSPPASDQGSPSPQSAPALAQLDRRIPRANPGHPQSRRGPAARSASSHPGGDQGAQLTHPKPSRSLLLAKARSPPGWRPASACGQLGSRNGTSSGWQSSTFANPIPSRSSITSNRGNANTPWSTLQRPWDGPGTGSYSSTRTKESLVRRPNGEPDFTVSWPKLPWIMWVSSSGLI